MHSFPWSQLYLMYLVPCYLEVLMSCHMLSTICIILYVAYEIVPWVILIFFYNCFISTSCVFLSRFLRSYVLASKSRNIYCLIIYFSTKNSTNKKVSNMYNVPFMMSYEVPNLHIYSCLLHHFIKWILLKFWVDLFVKLIKCTFTLCKTKILSKKISYNIHRCLSVCVYAVSVFWRKQICKYYEEN